MKSMKKLLVLSFSALMSVALFGCGGNDVKSEQPKSEAPISEVSEQPSTPVVEQTNAELAAEYLRSSYKDIKTANSDFSMPKSAAVWLTDTESTTVTLNWTLTLAEGGVENAVVIDDENSTDENVAFKVTYDAESSTVESPFTLSCTVVDSEGNEASFELHRSVPQFQYTDHIGFANVADNTEVNVLGTITHRMDNYKSFIMVDSDGYGYYVYQPTEYLDSYQVGTQVLVSGKKTTFNKQLEFAKGSSVKVLGNTENYEVNYMDVTELMGSASSQTDEKLLPTQNTPVQVKDAVMGGVSADGKYYYFTVNGVQYYWYYSTSYIVNQAALDSLTEEWVQGYKFDIYGVMTVYSGSYYILPADGDSINITERTLSDAQKAENGLAYAKGFIKDEFNKDEVIALPATDSASGATLSYETVSGTGYSLSTEGGYSLAITRQSEKTTNVIKVTSTVNDEVKVEEVTFTVGASTIQWTTVAEAIEICSGLENKVDSADKYYIYGTVGEIYNQQYFDLYLLDGDNSIVLYGLWQDEINNAHRYGTKDGYLGTPDIQEGDLLCVYGNLQSYDGKAEITNALWVTTPAKGTDIVNPYNATEANDYIVANVEAGKTSEEWYYVTGTIGEIYNEQYFDFYLLEGDTQLVVYGLWQDEINNAHRYGTKDGYLGTPEGFDVGDTVTLLCQFQNYQKNDTLTPELVNAKLISIVDAEPAEE